MTVISEWIAAAADRQGDAPYLEDAGLQDAAGGGTLTYAGLRRASQEWAPADRPEPADRHFIRKNRRAALFEARNAST